MKVQIFSLSHVMTCTISVRWETLYRNGHFERNVTEREKKLLTVRRELCNNNICGWITNLFDSADDLWTKFKSCVFIVVVREKTKSTLVVKIILLIKCGRVEWWWICALIDSETSSLVFYLAISIWLVGWICTVVYSPCVYVCFASRWCRAPHDDDIIR